MLRWTTITVLACSFAAITSHDVRAQAQPEAQQFAAFVASCDKRLAADKRFFERITLLKTKKMPFIFYVQRPLRDEAAYQRKVVNSYLPFLVKLVEIFEKEYATPLKLARRQSTPGFAIVVLSSRGSYNNYAQAIQYADLHHARAHYDPELQLAVTYVDAFAPGNPRPEERHAVLHEIVHALQHAYSTTGKMPKPVWFNEGLAEYRSASTHLADSLDRPLLDQYHLAALASVLATKKYRPLMAPLQDLIAAESYADVVKRAQKRFGAPPNAQLALQIFYAQSAAFVEFMHTGEGGRHRPAFQQYTDAVMRGKGSEDAFLAALRDNGGLGIRVVEASFQKHILAQTERRLHLRFRPGAGALNASGGRTALPPPLPYDSTKLAWRDGEEEDRVAAARAKCVGGEYEAALQLLDGVLAGKDATDQAATTLAKRVQARVATTLRLRDQLLEQVKRAGKWMYPTVGGTKFSGKLMAYDGKHFVLKKGKTEHRLPLTALGPKNLAFELKKRGFIQDPSWQKAWLDWLSGVNAKRALHNLPDTDPVVRDLRGDLSKNFDPGPGAAAAALVSIQRLEPAKDRNQARKQLDALRHAIRQHGKGKLFASRRVGLQQCVTALAQRVFSLEDPRCLGLSGKVKRTGDGRITVHYKSSSLALVEDFQHDKDYSAILLKDQARIANPTPYLRSTGTYFELGGSGVFSWRFSLGGRQVIEAELELVGSGNYSLLLCGTPGRGGIECHPDGTCNVYGFKGGRPMSDSVGTQQKLFGERKYKLRVEHDGKQRVQIFLDGKMTADLEDVGSLNAGAVALVTHCSNPIRIHSLTIQGTLVSDRALQLRQQFVKKVLDEIWP